MLIETKRKLIAAVCLSAAACGFYAYAVRADSYMDRFLDNTTINGIDVSGQSVEEAEDSLAVQVENYALTIIFPDGAEEKITADQIGAEYKAGDTVENLLQDQNRWAWAGKFFGKTQDYTTDIDFKYNKSKLQSCMKELPEFQDENITESADAGMTYDESKKCFVTLEEVYGNRLKESKVCEALIAAVDAAEESVTIDDSSYIKPELLANDENLQAQIKDLNDFLSTTITINLHNADDYVINADRMVKWLKQDDENPNWYSIDEDMIRESVVEAVSGFSEKEDVLYTSYSFRSTKRGTVQVPCSAYGYTVDQEAEVQIIFDEVMNRESDEHYPAYSREDSAPVGDSYAEVDIQSQEVFIYVDGKLVVDVSCVTGTDTNAERRTDRGLFYVYQKLKNHTMLGPRDKTGKPSYTSHTNFAVYFNRGEAFHDASWRSKFGGTIYKYSGSHGCVNLSYDSAKKVWDNTYVGMPVIVFG